MSDETTEQVADKYVDKSVDTGKVEAEVDAEKTEEPVKTEKPEKADAGVQDAKDGDKNPFEVRIKELTDKVRSGKRASDAQLFEVRAENERLRKELESKPEVQEPLKSLEDFEFNEVAHREYLDKRTASIAEKAASSAVGKVQTQLESGKVEQDFRTRESAFESEVSDYADVVYGEVSGKRTWTSSPAMADEIRLSEIGPEIAYHLAKNPEVASEISTLSDRETVRRMTLLESSIKSEKAKKGESVSKAPPPPPKLPKGEEGLDKDPANMSDSEFAKWRRKQISNR